MKTATASKAKLVPEVRPTAALQMYLETLVYKTRERLELINITRDLNEVVHKHGLIDDMKSFLERLVGRLDYWRHNDPKLSECDRKNADSHLRAMMLGQTLQVPVRDGELALGYWQSIILAELDGPRDRSVQVQVLGVPEEKK